MSKLFIQRKDDRTYLLGLEVNFDAGLLETAWTEDIAEALCITENAGTFKRPYAEFEKRPRFWSWQDIQSASSR